MSRGVALFFSTVVAYKDEVHTSIHVPKLEIGNEKYRMSPVIGSTELCP